MQRGKLRVIDLFATDPALVRTAVLEGAAAGSEAKRRCLAAIDSLAVLLKKSGGAQGTAAAGQHPC